MLQDPIFHAQAVVLGLVDPDDMNVFRSSLFDSTHQPSDTPTRRLAIQADLTDEELVIDVSYTIQAVLSEPYTRRKLQALSRAIYKIAVESVAWHQYVKGNDAYPFDLYEARFDQVRAWTRQGQPMTPVRPFLRRHAEELVPQWEERVWSFDDDVAVELKLLGDWFGVVLTGSPADARHQLIEKSRGQEKLWLYGDRIERAP